MRISLPLLLAVLPLFADAAIYRWVDSEGTIHFSDQKPNVPGVEEVRVSPPNVMSTDKPAAGQQGGAGATSASKKAPASVPPRYQSLQITSPGNDEAVRANDGTVVVSCALQPPLGTAAGHSIVVVLDGRKIGGLAACGTTLTQLSRGTHTLQVQVVDSMGKVLISSPVHSFHVLRTSRL